MYKIDKNGDPLVKIAAVVDWKIFRPDLEKARAKERKSEAGAKGHDIILLFKILILQSLYNLFDDALEFQILDRYSFGRFLGLHLGSKAPDATIVWRFREDPVQAGIIEELFEKFDAHLQANGFEARKGQIKDASIVNVPNQRNSRDENRQIKDSIIPEGWPENKKRQKDANARWAKKNSKIFFGYKNHVAVEVKHELIRGYMVTHAAIHDSNIFEELFEDKNTSRDV